MRNGHDEPDDLRSYAGGIPAWPGELVDERETRQCMDGVHDFIRAQVKITRGGHAPEQDADALQASRIPICFGRNTTPEHFERVEAPQNTAMRRVEAAEDRDELLKTRDRIVLGERLRQPDQPSRFGQNVKDCFEERLTGPEAVVDGQARDVGLTGDCLDAEGVAAAEDGARGGNDPRARLVNAGLALL